MSRQLLKSTAVTGGMTLLSRVTGLVRDVAFARLIGAGGGIAADAFYVAFRIPNFFRRLSAEGAFSQAFVPVYSGYTKDSDARVAADFCDSMLAWFGLALFVMTLIGVIAAPLFIVVMAPGFLQEAGKYELTVTMLRLTFPYLFFISLVAMAAGILNTRGRFAAAAFTPVLLNICLIIAALWLAPRMQEPVEALAWGVFAAGIVQLLFQLPFLHRLRVLPRPRFWPVHAGVRKVLRLMVPGIIGVSAAQINILISTLLASLLVTGSVSWLYYADRIMEFPLGIFGVAAATVILPSLSRLHAGGEGETFSHQMNWALRWIIAISVPAAVGMIVLADQIVTTLFQYGAFTPADVSNTGSALIAFAIGLVALNLVRILATGFFARQNTKTPTRVALLSMAVNVVVSLILFYPLGHVGLALAISIAACVNAGSLYYLLRRENIFRPESGWIAILLRTVAASLLMAGLLWWLRGETDLWIVADITGRVSRLALCVVVGVVAYACFLWLFGMRPRHFAHETRAS